jgi:hypothetical protein
VFVQSGKIWDVPDRVGSWPAAGGNGGPKPSLPATSHKTMAAIVVCRKTDISFKNNKNRVSNVCPCLGRKFFIHDFCVILRNRRRHYLNSTLSEAGKSTNWNGPVK